MRIFEGTGTCDRKASEGLDRGNWYYLVKPNGPLLECIEGHSQGIFTLVARVPSKFYQLTCFDLDLQNI